MRRSETGARIDVLLSVDLLSKSYGGRPVVHDVSLAVRRGEAVGLLGRNGAGKTTIFSMIAGLLSADKGRIVLDGADLTNVPLYLRARRGIGYLPQQPSIFRGLTVEQNILLVLEMHEPDAARRKRRLEGLLNEFGLGSLRRSLGLALSGGERRRCEIARALASRPNYILLDEPFTGIDPILLNGIRALVGRLTKRGIGILITDHKVRETLSLVNRAYIIEAGRVLVHGSADEVVSDHQVRRLYLGEGFRL